MNTIVSHYGRTGDIIWSLWWVKALSQKIGQKITFHIQTNVKIPLVTQIEKTHSNPTIHMSVQSAEFLKPLLQNCQFIDQVLISDQIPSGAINLNTFRSEGINLYSGDLRDAYFNFTDYVLQREYQKPILDVQPDYKYKDKILFTLTERYVNTINYIKLKQFEDSIVFIGTEKEYLNFNQSYFKIKQKIAPSNMLEVARYMKGAKGYIANETGFFALAEALKVPRILLPPDYMFFDYRVVPGPKNVIPIGGWSQSISKANKLPDVVSQMLSL